MNEEYEKFISTLEQILYKINKDEDIKDIKEFVEVEINKLEQTQKQIYSKREELYLDKLVQELK